MGLATVDGITMNNIVIRQTFIGMHPAWTFITTICLSGCGKLKFTIPLGFMMIIGLTILKVYIEMFIIQEAWTEEIGK